MSELDLREHLDLVYADREAWRARAERAEQELKAVDPGRAAFAMRLAQEGFRQRDEALCLLDQAETALCGDPDEHGDLLEAITAALDPHRARLGILWEREGGDDA